MVETLYSMLSRGQLSRQLVISLRRWVVRTNHAALLLDDVAQVSEDLVKLVNAPFNFSNLGFPLGDERLLKFDLGQGRTGVCLLLSLQKVLLLLLLLFLCARWSVLVDRAVGDLKVRRLEASLGRREVHPHLVLVRRGCGTPRSSLTLFPRALQSDPAHLCATSLYMGKAIDGCLKVALQSRGSEFVG